MRHYVHAHVVYNPAAGLAAASDTGRWVSQQLAAVADGVTLCQGADRTEVVANVRAALAQGADVVVAVGGDGTVSWVADALARTDVPLGVIPTGTGNVLARELQIPLEIHAALHLLRSAHAVRRIDAMQVKDTYYLLNVSTGISAQLMRATSPAHKRQLGMLAYLLAAVQQLSGVQLRRFLLFIDGRRMRVRASEVAVVNASTIGLQLLRWAPDIQVDDGQLELCILRASTAADLLRVFFHALLGRQRQDPALRIIPITGGVTIMARHDVPIQADGDVIGWSPVHVALVPRALGVIVPLPGSG
jgi:YegS/Rv2252/BmrU family lipid kinase